MVALVDGVPSSEPEVCHFTDPVQEHLEHRMHQFGESRGRRRIVEGWARCRGRVSSTEVASISELSLVRAGALLKEMSGDGIPEGSSPSGRGHFCFSRPR